MPDLHQTVVTYLSLADASLGRQTLTFERRFSSDLAGCHFPAVNSGRELRALIASLLL
jgi:hypothetical protein